MTSAEGMLGELALADRLAPDELRRLFDLAGVGERVAVIAFALREAQDGLALLERRLPVFSGAGFAAICDGLLCAVVGCDSSGVPDPPTLAVRLRRELSAELGEVGAAASRAMPSGELSRGLQEARWALQVSRVGNGGAPEVGCYDDLGALKLLLSLQPREALAAYCRIALGAVEAQEAHYGEELLRSLDAFIEHNGHWEQAARALYCHRHTLRYRMRRVEQLTKRDLSRARDRIELWMALRGRELVRRM